MSKARAFYLIDERTNLDGYCKRHGLKPSKFEEKSIDTFKFTVVYQYEKSGFFYEVLYGAQCYSGYDTVLTRLPKLSSEGLLEILSTAKRRDDILGAIGSMLREHPKELEQYLLQLGKKSLKRRKEIKRKRKLLTYIYRAAEETIYYSPFNEEIYSLCKKLLF